MESVRNKSKWVQWYEKMSEESRLKMYARSKKYRAENREKVNAQKRAVYQENKQWQ